MPLYPFPSQDLRINHQCLCTATTYNDNNNNILKKETSFLDRSLAKGLHFSMCSKLASGGNVKTHYYITEMTICWNPNCLTVTWKALRNYCYPSLLTLLIQSFYDFMERKLLFYNCSST